jgi:hypothetical protein
LLDFIAGNYIKLDFCVLFYFTIYFIAYQKGKFFVQEHMVVVDPECLPDSVLDLQHEKLVSGLETSREASGWIAVESVFKFKKQNFTTCKSCFYQSNHSISILFNAKGIANNMDG